MAIDHDVARFAGEAMSTSVDLAAEHEAGTDTGAECDIEQIVDALTRAELMLGPGGSGGIVVDQDGNVEAFAKQLLEREVDKFGDVG